MTESFTEDRLLGGRVALKQPAAGYRAGIDPVLLAASVGAQAGERVLDVGSGAGAAALCLAVRVPGALVVGLDADRASVGLAAGNAQATGVADRAQFYICDLRSLPVRLSPGIFDHVMTNPPYLKEAGARPSPTAHKAMATVEGEVPLADWLQFCVKMVRPRGTVSVIHRADRLHEVLAALDGRLGELTILPLWPGGDGEKAAKRILVRGRRGVAGPLSLVPGLVLHRPDGQFTEQAERVLRNGAPLQW